MLTHLSRAILALSVTIQLIAALPAPSDGTEQTPGVYYALPNTDRGSATNTLITETGLAVRPVATATVTVTVTVTDGAFSILPVDSLTTRVPEATLSVLPVDSRTARITGFEPTGNLAGIGAGINTNRPPLAISSLSGQPPEVVSQASTSALATINAAYSSSLADESRLASSMASSMMAEISSMSSAARVTARSQMMDQVNAWNYWCQTFIREGRETFGEMEGAPLATMVLPTA